MTLPRPLACIALLASLAVSAPAWATEAPWCKAGKPVKLGGLNWESGALLTELIRTVLEQGYGCQTETVPGNTVTLENALASNDIQIIAEEWVGRSEAWNKAASAGKVKAVGKVIVGATEGWYVPDYVINGDAKRGIKAAAPKLKAVSDLPGHIALFRDAEEPAKGRFLNCPTGWTCEGVNSQKLKAYKLEGSYVNFRPGTGAALDAEISSAYQRGKPILFYYWAPTALMGKYKFIKLQEPAYNEACFKTLANKDHPSPCGSAAPEALIQTALSKPLADGDPALTAFLTRFNVPIERLNQSLAHMADNKLDAAAEAKLFFAAQPKVWQAWVPADVAAKLKAAPK
ncbi:Glycine betaine/proline betaine-binding periplasmic protein [Andreprevotia sp. IGB-42]|uniref:ABC transporter substrate-binding protein n=1 Tax=Andreprevotia sp. IGB-42 TaxID=2497473 RepID=UPI001359BA4D|nr:ABC transporter substrate-binding protein [Andreprevotia sp. IGB-42]KAF0815460.1 Glycine betaine/proline betaine-binding periplasmic protein [Andreprevotia sp. IGB-42]